MTNSPSPNVLAMLRNAGVVVPESVARSILVSKDSSAIISQPLGSSVWVGVGSGAQSDVTTGAQGLAKGAQGIATDVLGVTLSSVRTVRRLASVCFGSEARSDSSLHRRAGLSCISFFFCFPADLRIAGLKE